MKAWEIRIDRAYNRLCLVIRRTLSKAEIESASGQVLAAVDRLRPGFSINVSKDLAPPDECERFSVVRVNRHVSRILEAADSKLVA